MHIDGDQRNKEELEMVEAATTTSMPLVKWRVININASWKRLGSRKRKYATKFHLMSSRYGSGSKAYDVWKGWQDKGLMQVQGER
jgi:hypothetical protein